MRKWNADLRSLRIAHATSNRLGFGSGKLLWIPIYRGCPTYGCVQVTAYCFESRFIGAACAYYYQLEL